MSLQLQNKAKALKGKQQPNHAQQQAAETLGQIISPLRQIQTCMLQCLKLLICIMHHAPQRIIHTSTNSHVFLGPGRWCSSFKIAPSLLLHLFGACCHPFCKTFWLCHCPCNQSSKSQRHNSADPGPSRPKDLLMQTFSQGTGWIHWWSQWWFQPPVQSWASSDHCSWACGSSSASTHWIGEGMAFHSASANQPRNQRGAALDLQVVLVIDVLQCLSYPINSNAINQQGKIVLAWLRHLASNRQTSPSQ